MKAAELKWVDSDYRNHLQAYLSFIVKAERKTGKYKSKPVYDKFIKFYDYDEAVNKIKSSDSKKGRFSGIGKLLKKGG